VSCPPSEAIVAQVRAETGPKTLLSFSRGKDAIGAYLAIRDHFDEVVPYHLFLVPGLEFVDESLAYYERVMGRKIWNLPHPSLYRWFNALVYQSPAHAAVLDAAALPTFEYLDVHQMVCQAEGIDVDQILVASGVRAADSPIRRVSFSMHGAISRAQRQYYPVWDWNKARLLEEIERSGIGLPVDYDLFGRSFDGLDLRFILPLKKHRPRDYAKVLEWFPLAEMEVWRYERFGKAA
jgi:hypothetical protein